MTEKGQRDEVRKLTAEMFWILLISAAAAVFLLVAMYRNRFGAYAFADSHGLLLDGREEYREWFLSQAPGYTLMPEKGKQYDAEERLPFVEKHCNKYIGVGIYEKSSGDYVAGYFPHMLTEQFFWSDWLWNDSAIMSSTELPMEFTAHFKDKDAEVLLYSYRAMQMIPFYFGGGVLLAVLVVLSPVLLFVHRRMGYLGKIREEVLVMAQGDLEHPLTVRGKDELASLSRELDCLRLALKENMEKEQGSREANRS